MATLKDYFVQDGGTNLTVHNEVQFSEPSGGNAVTGISRIHLDFEANAKFVSYYLPKGLVSGVAEIAAIHNVDAYLSRIDSELQTEMGFAGSTTMRSADMVFTGRVFVYSEDALEPRVISHIQEISTERNLYPVFRGAEYVKSRDASAKPRAFISHDSRDKAAIAEPLAIALSQMMCPIWYDEFSLRVGDSLRESIEKGLRECHKCVLVLTPNFLANGGWAKREYDSIFTRELIQDQKVILPIWHGVTAKDVYEYSPMLADRVGVQWELGDQKVAAKLLQSINAAA